MLVARDRLLASSFGEFGMSHLALLILSVCGILGSMFSFLLAVEDLGGDIILMGDPKRAGDCAFTGEAPRVEGAVR